jgi:two-component system chemotaxis response regulator CheB
VLQQKGGQVVFGYDDGPAIKFCKPAVDPMFESVAAIYKAATLALILTGMGQDGLAGARAVTEAGGTVIAQDEATSVVWGMPGVVARAGLASGVWPLEEIGPRISRLLRGERAL